MNAHRVAVLSMVAVAALVAALWSSQTRRPAQEAVTALPLVAGLEAGINEVSQVRVRAAGDALQATLKRVDGAWVLAEKDDYPVDVNVLREYLIKLARAKRVEAKTDNPALYDRLGVEEMSAKEATGAQIEIDGLAQPVKLIIGRNVTRGVGTYVRHAGEAQSWLADADLALERDSAKWLQRDLIDIASGRIERVNLVSAAGPAIQLVRAPEGATSEFAVANLPAGREAASEFVADATAGFLSGLRFDDVLNSNAAAPPESGLTNATFVTTDGISIVVKAWPAADKFHTQLSASLDETVAAASVAQAQAKAAREHEAAQALAAAKPAASDAAAATPQAATAKSTEAAAPPMIDPAQDREQRLLALRSEAESLNARFSGKTFVLPAFKAGNLSKTLEDFLKPKA